MPTSCAATATTGVHRRAARQFEDAYGASRAVYHRVTVQTTADGTRTYAGTHTADTIRVTLRQQYCQDSMSGAGFPTTVEVEVNGQRRQGCSTTLERER